MADPVDRLWVDSMPAAYERWLVPTVFHPFAVDLTRRIAASAPARILELAAGSGVLTHELVAAMPSAIVTATDLNEAMVALGATREPSATWQAADATTLPFDDASFDAVACQFGVMFFPDRPAAFREAGHVLGPDGRLHFNVWAALSEHVFQSALVDALELLFPGDAPTFMVSVVHGYADPDAIQADMSAAGLRCLSIESVELIGEAVSVADVAAGYCTGTPLRAALEARGDLTQLTNAVAQAMVTRLGAGPVDGSMAALVVEAASARP